MASNARPPSVVLDDQELIIEQRRLFNFLKRYDLHQYHKAFLENGVKRLTHLKDVAQDDDSLDMVGLSRPERMRLRKKVKENVQWMGRMKKKLAGKASIFDDPAPESAQQPILESSTTTYHAAAIITKDQVKLGKRIGEGAHGSVHEGTWSNVHGGVAVAIKTLYGSQEVQRQFIDEANSMASIRHKHIIQLYGIVLSQPFMLIEELASFGNLHSYLKGKGASLNLNLFHTYASQIADAMRYLESRRVVHRDLAARNILLVHKDFVKLSDFGMAKILDENSEVYNLSNLAARIPIAWTAVESLTRAKFSAASDIWSYGVVLWEIYSIARTPWEGLGPIDIRDHLVRGERLSRPKRCPTEMYSLMESCWRQNPQDRPSFETVYMRVQHLSPRLVRAVKVHDVAEDVDSLSFKIGDIIYLINKPKPEWMFGMTKDGKIGHFLSDHVTDILNPIGDIRAKLDEGKTKASDLVISGPTDVERVFHWGSDGRKWTTNNTIEEDFVVLGQPENAGNGQSSNSSGNSSPTCISPPFRVQNSHSPSPGFSASPHDPLSPQHRVAGRLSTGDSRFIYSQGDAAKMGGSGVKYGDANFLGNQRYIPADQMGAALSPNPDFSRQKSEDNQYVTIVNSIDPSVGDTFSKLKQQKLSSPGTASPPQELDEQEEYLKMESCPIQRGGSSERKPVPYLHFSPSNHRNVPAFAETGEGNHTHRGANVIDSNSSPPTALPELLQPTKSPPPIPPKGTMPSQYSYVTPTNIEKTPPSSAVDAVMPRVRYMSTSSKRKSPESEHKVEKRFGSKSVKSRAPPLPPAEDEMSGSSPSRQRYGSDSSMQVKPKILPRRSNTSVGTKNNSTTNATAGVGTTSAGADQSEELLSQLQNLILRDEEFRNCSKQVCRESLVTFNCDVEKAKVNMRVQMLLGMRIPFIDASDCKRALSHCQHKTDRAAEWLLQLSEDIELRKT